MSLRIEWFGDREICIGGIGKMYYQDGFPIEMSADLIMEKFQNVEISWFHVADELIKNGWTDKRIINTISNSLGNTRYESLIPKIIEFVHAEYEDSRTMIFEYLFGGNIELAKTKARSIVTKATN